MVTTAKMMMMMMMYLPLVGVCVCVSAFLWERREKLDMTSFYPFSPLWCTGNVLWPSIYSIYTQKQQVVYRA